MRISGTPPTVCGRKFENLARGLGISSTPSHVTLPTQDEGQRAEPPRTQSKVAVVDALVAATLLEARDRGSGALDFAVSVHDDGEARGMSRSGCPRKNSEKEGSEQEQLASHCSALLMAPTLRNHPLLSALAFAPLLLAACEPPTDDNTDTSGSADTTGDPSAGDGDGDPSTGDGDGDPSTGDGDGDPSTGDGDGDPNTGDGDGDPSGDGDGDPSTGDGDGDHVPEQCYALSLDGVTQYVDAIDPWPAGSGESFTIDAWIWPESENGRKVIYSAIHNADPFYYQGAEFAMIDGELQLTLGMAGDPWIAVSSGVSVPLDTWNHVAASYENFDGAGFAVHLWINGTHVAEFLSDANTILQPNEFFGHIGSRPSNGALGSNDFLFDGRIYSIRIDLPGSYAPGVDFTPDYELALSDETVALWTLDEGEGEIGTNDVEGASDAEFWLQPVWLPGCPANPNP